MWNTFIESIKSIFKGFGVGLIICMMACCVILAVVVPIVGCKQNKPDVPVIDGTNIIKVVYFGEGGHDWRQYYYQDGTFSDPIHDPDCHCFEDEKQLVEELLYEAYD